MNNDVQEEGWWPRTLLNQVDSVLKFLLVAGAIFTVYQYLDAKRVERVKQTLSYIERFEGEDTAAAHQAISEELRAQRPAFERINAQPATQEAAKQARTLIAKFLAYDAGQGRGLAAEIDVLISFFSSLQICIEQGLCEAKVAHAFFDEYVNAFWANFEPYVAERRESASAFGGPMERFVKATGVKGED